MAEAVAEEAELAEAMAEDEIIIMVAEAEVVVGEAEEEAEDEDEEGGHPLTMQLCKKFKIASHVKVRILVASLSFPRGKGNRIH